MDGWMDTWGIGRRLLCFLCIISCVFFRCFGFCIALFIPVQNLILLEPVKYIYLTFYLHSSRGLGGGDPVSCNQLSSRAALPR
ncbi:hypothetical protein BC567DRAFT_223885 [Phyllosticta citribraziliensis]